MALSFQITFTVAVWTLAFLPISNNKQNSITYEHANFFRSNWNNILFRSERDNLSPPSIFTFWLNEMGLNFIDPTLTLSALDYKQLSSETMSVFSSLKLQPMKPTRVIQKVLPVGSYLCSGKWNAFKIFYNNTFNLWLHCVKISFLNLLYFFLGVPNTPAGFGAPETDKK